MTAGVFDGVWPYGQRLIVRDKSANTGRSFMGFVEPLNLTSDAVEDRNRAGLIPNEKYRLIAAPSEVFPYGTESVIVFGCVKFEVLSIKEIYSGEKVSHRECVLIKVGEEQSDA